MRIKILFLFLIISSLVLGQTESDERMPEQWGLVRINDSLLADQTEIKVGEWLDYIFYHDATDSSQYIHWRKRITEAEIAGLMNATIDSAFLPDKNVLNQLPEKYLFTKCKNCELISFRSLDTKVQLPVEKDSLKNAESKWRLLNYLELPVVGITFEQAVEFCNWRTRMDSIRWYFPPDSKMKLFYRHDYLFKLPTPEEFDKMNSALDSLSKKKKPASLFNYKDSKYPDKVCKELEKEQCGKSRVKVFSFYPNSNQNTTEIQGNVSEMTSIKGVAKGGSYNHYAKESYPGVNNYYDKPELWLGFRCVVVRKEAKSKDPCVYKKYNYKNGKLKEEGYECEIVNKQAKNWSVSENKKEGIWKEYDEEGSLRYEHTYKDDKVTGPYKKFYKSGAIHETGQLVDYQEVDTMRIYDENGSLISLIVWALHEDGGFEMKSERIYKVDAKPTGTLEEIDGETYLWQYGERVKTVVYDGGIRRRPRAKKK